ncbi:rRNA maturation RNase YbeY [Candidatus Puniceispirillum sp.]|uniref:rRNA maturation RNase YbeY n=1 Tax=Candidatus Puniceispirillum sp. TaxID=2026719 RepID=UPI003F6A0BCD
MIDTNPEPDSLTSVHADHGDAMSNFNAVQWHTPDAHQIEMLIDHDCWSAAITEHVKAHFCQMLDRALAAHDMKDCAINLLLCSDVKIQQLNYDHRSIDKATNVLSFPAADADDIPFDKGAITNDDNNMLPSQELGDIAIAHGICAREAEESGISITDHITHLFGHGVLHLLGYGHEQDAEADEMEALEISLLDALGIANPYVDKTGVDKAKVAGAPSIMSKTEPAS